MTTDQITPVTDPAALNHVGALIAYSFDHLDANHYLIPDPEHRLTAMTEYFTMLTEHAAAGAGQVWQTTDGSAAAVWFDRTTEPTEPTDYTRRVKELAGPYVDRFHELDAAFDADHPTDPHWHLAFLAVHPSRQRTGVGATLITHTHQWLDERGLPAYLEATNPDNQRFYRQHTYQDMTPSAITIGNPHTAGATFYRMWRTPRS